MMAAMIVEVITAAKTMMEMMALAMEAMMTEADIEKMETSH